jgi:ABC-type nitrate/sulfonate/bicarbonate transport system substrate-binding protein
LQLSFTRGRRWAGATLVLAALGAGAVNTGSAHAADRIKVAISSYTAPYAPLYVGKAKGFFRREGIDLQLLQVGAQTSAAIVSGQADLAGAGITGPFAIANQGKNVAVISASFGGGVTGFIAGKRSLRSVKQCKSMATFTRGATTYAWSVALMGSGSRFLPQTAFADIANNVASGRVDCGTGTYDIFAPLVAQGKAKFLVDTRRKNTMPAYLRGMPESGFFGLREKVRAKRSIMIRWLRAYRASVRYFNRYPPAQLANETRQVVAGYRATPASVLAKALEIQRSFYAPEDGMIRADDWPNILRFVRGAGNTFIRGSKFDYRQICDMSFLRAALR